MNQTTWDYVKNLPETAQEALLNRFGYRVTGNKHIDCPICGKKNSGGDGFRINWTTKLSPPQYAGICTCGCFGIWQMLTATGADIHAINDAAGFKYNNCEKPAEIKKPPKLERAESIFRRGLKLYESEHAKLYFANRGIYDLPRGHIRIVENLEYRDCIGAVTGRYDAIVALATDSLGKPCYYHVTYIKDGEKAPCDTPRKMFSLLSNDIKPRCSIKLGGVAEVMGVAEGIETAASYEAIYKVRTDSCMNAGLLEDFRPQEHVKTLHIAADNDRKLAGNSAAWKLATRVRLSCPWVEKIIIRWPKEMGKDFNDVLLEGLEVFEYEC
ncbi:MAG: toprim domain-containing protein [Marinagarivorans sp.]|nr:toprim domain-containing protein [Marinagarivorans sp.]